MKPVPIKENEIEEQSLNASKHIKMEFEISWHRRLTKQNRETMRAVPYEQTRNSKM